MRGTRVLLRRLLHLALVLGIVSVGTFLLTEVVPGDPTVAILGSNAAPEQYELLHAELGLDRSLPDRYLEWMRGAVTGDFGETLIPPRQAVTDLVRSRLPVTAEIAAFAMLVAVAVAVPLGTWSAYRAGRPAESVVTGAAFAVLSVPSFLAALLLVYAVVLHQDGWIEVLRAVGLVAALAIASRTVATVVRATRAERPDRRRAALGPAIAALALGVAAVTAGSWWPDLPRQGFVRLTDDAGLAAHLRSLALPALTLGILEGVVLLRVLRNDMIGVLSSDYVMAARAKGIPDRQVLLRHALRPASLTMVTLAGVSLGRLLGGTVIMETIFGLPGMGTLLVDAVTDKDYRVVQAGVLVISTLYVLINAAVDVSYDVLDPRIRRGRR